MPISKNGKKDIVAMGQSCYEEQQARLELYEKLEEAEREQGKGISHEQLMAKLKKLL